MKNRKINFFFWLAGVFENASTWARRRAFSYINFSGPTPPIESFKYTPVDGLRVLIRDQKAKDSLVFGYYRDKRDTRTSDTYPQANSGNPAVASVEDLTYTDGGILKAKQDLKPKS